MVNFNERIGALECKLSEAVAQLVPGSSPSPTLKGQATSTQAPAELALSGIWAEFDCKLDQERVLSRAANAETRLMVDSCAENLAVLARKVDNQERSQEDFRELQENFFTEARVALARVESSPCIALGHVSSSPVQLHGNMSLMRDEDVSRSRMAQQLSRQSSHRDIFSHCTPGSRA